MIITQPKDEIAAFVAEMNGFTGPRVNYYTALAKVDSKGIACGVIYDNFTPGVNGIHDCRMHVSARPGAIFATRDFVRHAFAYPFIQLGCRRVTGLVPRKNKKARRFDEHLGFEFEACIKEAIPGDDIIVYRMFADKCRWI